MGAVVLISGHLSVMLKPEIVFFIQAKHCSRRDHRVGYHAYMHQMHFIFSITNEYSESCSKMTRHCYITVVQNTTSNDCFTIYWHGNPTFSRNLCANEQARQYVHYCCKTFRLTLLKWSCQSQEAANARARKIISSCPSTCHYMYTDKENVIPKVDPFTSLL